MGKTPSDLALHASTCEEELRAADPGLLSPFYADDADFDGSAGRSAQLLKLLTRRGPDQGYFPELA